MRQIEFVPAEVLSCMEPAELGSDWLFNLYCIINMSLCALALQEDKCKLFPVSLRLEFY